MDIKIQKIPLSCSVLFFLCFLNITVNAQKYNFQHYSLSSGLLQSQVLSICQDKAKQIWLSTSNGIDCFDGKQFNSFTVEDGLTSNPNFALTCDNNGHVWWGGDSEVTSFSNEGIKYYPFKLKRQGRAVEEIVCDKNNTIWVLAHHKLFKKINDKLVAQIVQSDDEIVSDIKLDKNKNVYTSVLLYGIYKLKNNTWQLNIPLKGQYISAFIFDNKSQGGVFFNVNNQIFKYNTDSTITKVYAPGPGSPITELVCMVQDEDNGIWLGTNKGAILLKNGIPQFFNESNGFTDERVFSVFRDVDNRIWLGTDGSGLYSYMNNGFLIFDKTQGIKNDVIMSLAKNAKGDIFIATNGAGLLSYTHKKIVPVVLPTPSSSTLRVNYIYTDRSDNLWVGTDIQGLWQRKPGKSFTQIFNAPIPIHFITEDDANKIWVATIRGCFYIDNNILIRVPIKRPCNTLINIGIDSMLVGTLNGVALVKNKQVDSTFRLKPLEKEYVLCFKKYGSSVLIGTNDHGLFIWDIKTNAIQNINTKSGLNSNTIYSIDIVKNQVWLGTGRGVSKFGMAVIGGKIKLKQAYVANFVTETNENSILHTDSTVWVGTINGVNIYPINPAGSMPVAPSAIIQSVGLFADTGKKLNYTYKNGYKLPVGLSLPSDKSHLEIKFQSVQFADEKINYYQYQLEGIDECYSKPIASNFVDYPNLPPGKYTFKVRALNAAWQFKDPATFSFVITPIFTETIAFKVFLLLLLLSATYGIYWYKRYQDKQELIYIGALKLKEQEAVRRQTAEDFHDDLGNKLTRINMLSELLDKKIKDDKPDEKQLISQIKSSASEMYAGTKNILWALNPDNDNMGEVYGLVEKFACELFSNTGISFRMIGNLDEIKKIRLPLGFSRSIILICKELLTNVLKHSSASDVTLAIETTSIRHIVFTLTDNGKGFDSNSIAEGNGIRNMQNRAKRLNGSLLINSSIGNGTISTLTMPIP